jgi:hypothetical protein
MEGIVQRISRMLGLWLHPTTRPVRPMPQGKQTIPSDHQNAKAMKLTESIQIVTDLRAKGWTYKSISLNLGMSRQRAHQIFQLAKQRQYASTLWTHGLSVRNITILGKLGITSKQEAREAIKSGRIRPIAFKNYGIKSYSQLVTWLDEQQP